MLVSLSYGVEPVDGYITDHRDARPTFTFPAAEHHVALRSVQNYTAWLQRHIVCEQLGQGCYMRVERSGVESTKVQRPNHYTTMPNRVMTVGL